MDRLRRKIDQYLIDWKNSKNKMPLIIKGTRQIGKTNAIKKNEKGRLFRQIAKRTVLFYFMYY